MKLPVVTQRLEMPSSKRIRRLAVRPAPACSAHVTETLSVLKSCFQADLAWSLDRVYSSKEGNWSFNEEIPPDLWIESVSSNPSWTNCVSEPTLTVVAGNCGRRRSRVSRARMECFLSIASLQYFLVLDIRAKVLQVNSRGPEGTWVSHTYLGNAVVPLEAIDINLNLANVWKFGSDATSHHKARSEGTSK